jgi:hypothetical protein
MSHKIEEWMERLRAAKNPGPVVRITVVRNGREVGWSYDLDEDTNLTELAERIDNAARGAGYPTCELRAFDEQGRFMEPLLHKIESTQIVQVQGGMSPGIQMGIEATMAASLKNNRDFVELGLESVKHAYQMSDRAMKRLEDENTELRRENERLRQKVTALWDVMEKINTHELETKQEMVKLEQLGNIGGTLMKAFMARVTGGNATPAGQAINFQIAMKLFTSLATDMDRVNQILPFLTNDEKLAVMELMRVVTEPERVAAAESEPTKVNGAAAASAAAAANARGAGRAS